jgi:hypothetical protein
MFGRLRQFYWTRCCQPACDRLLYRAAAAGKARRFLAIGLGSVERWLRVLEVARRAAGPARLEFAAVDPFEDRGANSATGPTLKEAYRRFSPVAKVRLAPGEPHEALRACANSWGTFDLVVIARGVDPDSLSRAWFYVPRLLHDATQTFWDRAVEPNRIDLQALPRIEIERLASRAQPRSRARRRAA